MSILKETLDIDNEGWINNVIINRAFTNDQIKNIFNEHSKDVILYGELGQPKHNKNNMTVIEYINRTSYVDSSRIACGFRNITPSVDAEGNCILTASIKFREPDVNQTILLDAYLAGSIVFAHRALVNKRHDLPDEIVKVVAFDVIITD